MKRKEFIEKMGIGAAFALTATCLGSCKKDKKDEPDTDVDFTLNLTDSANAVLLINGGYLVNDNVVVARNDAGEYLAATVICSHESNKNITLQDDEWYCTVHGARFSQTGEGLNPNGDDGLTIYKTELTGDLLRVFS